MTTTEETYDCPFCPAVVSDQVTVVPALHAFERHLDVHMARGDRLQVAS